VLWSTDCAVCLDKLPELRENARGWAGKPFDLVTVALDSQRTNADAYEQARRATRQGDGAAWTLWQGATTMPSDWKQSRPLPHTLLIDTEGRVVARFNGRIPAEAWNAVADLLP
jgi:thiol-disulfide isomerase/thioredoxin